MCLNFTDLLVSMYFMILVIADAIYQESITSYKIIWKRSFPFYLIFFLPLVFSINSPLLLLFISKPRLRVVTAPLKSKFKSRRYIVQCIVACILCGILLMSSLVIGYTSVHEQVPTTLCLPFIDPTDIFRFIKFITLITSIFQLCTSGILSMIYFLLIKVISKSSQYSHRNMSQDISIFYPIVQLVLLTSSNII